MSHRPIKMYGIKESWVTPGNRHIWEIREENDGLCDFRQIVDGIIVPLHIDVTDTEDYFGFEAEYPWDYRGLDLQNLQDHHIKTAIATFLKEYGFDYDEVYGAVDYISDVDVY